MEAQLFNIPSANMEKLAKKIKALNKKALKAGTGEIKITTISKTVDKNKDGTVDVRFQIALEGETPRINGWAFIARLDHNTDPSGGSNLVYVMPSADLPVQFRTAAANCEHCGWDRKRRDTYILQNEDTGEYKQVGRTCIRDFIGIDPARIAEQAERYVKALGLLDEAREPKWGGINDHRDICLPTYLSYVSMVIREHGWISGREAYEDQSKVSSASEACAEMFVVGHQPSIPSNEDKELAVAAMDHVLTLEPKNDFLHNIITITKQSYLDWKATGLAAAIMFVYNRHREEEAKREAAADLSKSEHVGALKERLEMEVKVIGKRWIEGYYGSSALIRMLDVNDNLFVTFASGSFGDDVNIGDALTIRGTVKKHDDFKGTKQTILNRVAKV